MFRPRSILPVIGAAAAATAITACGSGSPRTTTTSTAGPTQAQIQRFQTNATKFTDCMRNHGIANFPDPPNANDPNSGHTWKNAFSNSSPGFVSAETTCQHFMPNMAKHNQSSASSPAERTAMLAFARCVRSHGFPSFPDPTSAGITHQMIAAAGINLHQPAVLQAADACVSVTHGLLTKASVARFIAGQ